MNRPMYSCIGIRESGAKPVAEMFQRQKTGVAIWRKRVAS